MNRKALYLAGFAALVAVIALGRWDLVEQAARATMRQLERGGTARAWVLFEAALLAGILWLTAVTIPGRAEPRRDAVLVLLASAAGWAAEAWGTRLYLWRYYTAEAPPLWIVPAWPLGTLVIDRLSEKTASLLEKRLPENAYKPLYWTLALVSAFIFYYVTQPVLRKPATWAVAAALAAGFLVFPNPRRAVPFILTGFACVFLADLWGTTNFCWRYYIQHPRVPYGNWLGVGFGMAFDTAVVLVCWRLGDSLVERVLGPGDRKT